MNIVEREAGIDHQPHLLSANKPSDSFCATGNRNAWKQNLKMRNDHNEKAKRRESV